MFVFIIVLRFIKDSFMHQLEEMQNSMIDPWTVSMISRMGQKYLSEVSNTSDEFWENSQNIINDCYPWSKKCHCFLV